MKVVRSERIVSVDVVFCISDDDRAREVAGLTAN